MSAIKLVDMQGAVRLLQPAQETVDWSKPRKAPDGAWHTIVDGGQKMWVEKSGKRVIEGIASTGTMSSNRLVLNPKGCIARFPIPLLFRHGFDKDSRRRACKSLDSARIGEVVMVHKQPAAVVVRAIIDNTLAGDAAWERIESHEARCFSVGARDLTLRGIVDGDKFYQEWKLAEVSVCFQGANPDCVFDIVQAR